VVELVAVVVQVVAVDILLVTSSLNELYMQQIPLKIFQLFILVILPRKAQMLAPQYLSALVVIRLKLIISLK
jgi:hypothetical protein